MFGFLATTGLVGKTAHEIHVALCLIFRIDPCDPGPLPPGAAPSTGPSQHPTGNPWPTGNPGPSGSPGPSGGPSQGPGTQPVSSKPVNSCYQTVEIGYGEGNVTVPVRYINIRGGIRVGYQQRKITTPGQPDKWEVTIYGFGEGAVATPGSAEAQFGSDSTRTSSHKLVGNAWLGTNITGSETYVVNSQQEADNLPLKYAEHRAIQGANLSIKAGKLILDPAISLTSHIPFVGGKIEEAVNALQIPNVTMPARQNWSIESGPTGGFSGKAKLFGKLINGSVGGRYWHLNGVKVSANGEITYTMKESAEVEPSVIVDLDELLTAAKLGKQKDAITDKTLNAVEEAAKKRLGYELKIPPAVRKYIMENWPAVGVTAKGKISVSYQITVDKNGHASKFTEIFDHQWNYYVRGQMQGKLKNKDGSLNYQRPAPFLTSERTIEQRTVGMHDPQSAKAVYDFLRLQVPLSVVSPVTSPLVRTPEYDRMQKQINAAGTRTKLTYDSSVSNVKFTGEEAKTMGGGNGKTRKDKSLLELKVEHERNALSGAQTWDNTQQKWAPWNDCYRKP